MLRFYSDHGGFGSRRACAWFARGSSHFWLAVLHFLLRVDYRMSLVAIYPDLYNRLRRDSALAGLGRSEAGRRADSQGSEFCNLVLQSSSIKKVVHDGTEGDN